MRAILFRCALLFMVVVLPAGFVVAQTTAEKVRVKVRISPEEDANAKLRPYSIIRSSPSSIMIMRSGEFDVRAFGTLKSTLDLYDDAKLMPVRSQEPVMQRSGQGKLFLENLVYFAGKPMLIARGGGDEAVKLFWQPLDPNLTRPSPAFELFSEFPIQIKVNKVVAAQAGASIREPFRTAISRDSAKMVVYSAEIRDEEDEGAFYLFTAVDKEMRVLWNNILRLGQDVRSSEVMDVEVDHRGVAYVLLKNHMGESVQGKANSEIVLHRLTAEDMTQMTVSLGGYFIAGGSLHTLGGQVTCAGIYASHDADRVKAEGNFLASIDSTGEFGEPRLMPSFGENSLDLVSDPGELDDVKAPKDGAGAKDEKNQKRNASSTDVIAFIPRKDGGFFLVNEVNFIRERRDPETGRVSSTFYHGPLQARAFDAEGREQWSTFFKRWTISDTPLIGRVFAVDFNDRLFLFLLDSEDMTERRKAGQPITPKQTTTGLFSAYVTFDDNGAFKVKPVLKNDTNEDYISGWDITPTGPNEYVAFGTRSLTTAKFLPVKIEFSLDTKK